MCGRPGTHALVQAASCALRPLRSTCAPTAAKAWSVRFSYCATHAVKAAIAASSQGLLVRFGLTVLKKSEDRKPRQKLEILFAEIARKLGTCKQRQSYKRGVLESAVLELLRDRLMQPDAVAEFMPALTRETNRHRGQETAQRGRLATEHKALLSKLDGLYDAIADVLRTPVLKERVEEMEGQKAAIEARLKAPAPSPVRLHPGAFGALPREGRGAVAKPRRSFDPDAGGRKHPRPDRSRYAARLSGRSGDAGTGGGLIRNDRGGPAGRVL